ncbi:hypothetical protein [Dyadobacter fermentans]|uniref:hypothetical protein n=1 Tax=Dyadobacter fermentans TaxID=94254 RepID=UPI001CBECCF4|nr:hypothetical protein [Dyadobacter fermentans]MBZ1362158.1 hypothetical protein [Dyadobacter fermentans]
MSKVIKFLVPQIVFEAHEVEVADDFELEELAWEHRIDFIYENLSDLDKQWIGSPAAEKDHKKIIEQAMDADYIYIKEVNS